MTLAKASIEWAIDFIYHHSDGDLFPKVLELAAVQERKGEFANEIAGKPLSGFKPGPHRRFIVPKDEVSFRQATQLTPLDSIILSAIAYEFGGGIEARRRKSDQVFSYRFKPSAEHGLYNSHSAWNDFWKTAQRRASRAGAVLYCDIADFYNQIYHHTLENQLIASGFPNQATKWVISLMESTTAGVSRGVPVGPHATHLFAEASLIPIDNSMADSGIEFVRFADDIIVFSDDFKQARKALSRVASILDRQQRLTPQRHKTELFTPESFVARCAEMIEDRPISESEDRILGVLRRYTGGNPYISISYNDISEKDWAAFSEAAVSKVIAEYLGSKDVDYIRLRWFYRRLAQIGNPGAIDITLKNIEFLTPCFASICTYLSSVQGITREKWQEIGSDLLNLLQLEEIRESEYFRLSILSLFTRNSDINHFAALGRGYAGSDTFAKREITLAAKVNGANDWLRELKEDFGGMDYWQRLAYLFCCRGFPLDERKYFVNRLEFEDVFMDQLARWAKSN
ncbi:MAG: Retron-type reverse transcriptase [Mesorhizobium sp.]|uniref:RNA-directed DNA polymerase n=1 Tax=Mesorhizobium sp. TaxID=1871066 RepID=UPI0012041C8F|nr:RNA-directed DNA polymerase [Mesorhizobium sp.]TIQ37187.1 MAG: Retron-type reverse transcriptase [Mesorhizobium sp.]